jgi:NADPH:quinone reductase-like Zn-dependent oxidoreductase
MSLALEGKTALVTGSSRGIGRAIVQRLAANGAAVAINYTGSRQKAQEAVKEVVAKDGKAVAIQADVSKPAEVHRLFNEADRRWDLSTSLWPMPECIYQSRSLKVPRTTMIMCSTSTPEVSSSRCRRPLAVSGMAVESSSFPPAARSYPSPMLRFILAARRR